MTRRHPTDRSHVAAGRVVEGGDICIERMKATSCLSRQGNALYRHRCRAGEILHFLSKFTCLLYMCSDSGDKFATAVQDNSQTLRQL